MCTKYRDNTLQGVLPTEIGVPDTNQKRDDNLYEGNIFQNFQSYNANLSKP